MLPPRERAPNEGQWCLHLAIDAKGAAARSVFQVAQVTRPLVSIGEICDNGNAVAFTKEKGVVKTSGGKALYEFKRKQGLYGANFVAKRLGPNANGAKDPPAKGSSSLTR